MRLFTPLVYALVAAAVFVLGTGCSNKTLPLGPPVSTSTSNARELPKTLKPFVRNSVASMIPFDLRREPQPSWMRVARGEPTTASKDIAWVSAFGFPSPVNQYAVPNKNNNGPVCQTPGVYAVNNIGVDRSGNLWVPVGNNGPLTGYVQQYTCTGAQGTAISDPYGQPADVAIDSKGNAVVGNIVDFYPENGGFYLASGTANIYDSTGKFIGKLSDPSFLSPHPPGFDIFNLLTGVAVDANDNCYVSHFDNTGGGEVVEFPGCKPAKHGKVLRGPHPWSPGKPEFDSAGNLVITDYSFIYFYRIEYVSVYAPPYDGPPTKTFPLYGPPISCPLSGDQKYMYCADFVSGSVDVYSYPGGKYIYSFNNGLQTYGAQGIALVPGSAR